MIRVTKEDFESFKRHNDPEVFTQEQITAWVDMHKEVLQKSELNELDELEKAEVDSFTEEFRSFMQIEVVGRSADLLTKGLSYERFYVRERQVEFEKAEGDDIEKSRHGKYTNTALNRKLGRVGREYGKSAPKANYGHGDSSGPTELDGEPDYKPRRKVADTGKPNEGYGKGDKTEASQHSKKELEDFDSHLDKLGKDHDKRHGEGKEKEEKQDWGDWSPQDHFIVGQTVIAPNGDECRVTDIGPSNMSVRNLSGGTGGKLTPEEGKKYKVKPKGEKVNSEKNEGGKTEASQHTKKELDDFEEFVSKLSDKDINPRYKEKIDNIKNRIKETIKEIGDLEPGSSDISYYQKQVKGDKEYLVAAIEDAKKHGSDKEPEKAKGSDFESGKVHVWKQGGSGEILSPGDKFKISSDRKNVSVYIKENKEWEDYKYNEIFP